MPAVFYCSPTNGTFFTTCCSAAICDDQQKCPICKAHVYPFYKGMSDEDRETTAGGYYNSIAHKARANMAAAKAKYGDLFQRHG